MLIGLMTFVIYVFLILSRVLDPTQKVINLPYLAWLLVGIATAICVSYNFNHVSHYVLTPLSVLLVIEFFISVMYKRTLDVSTEDVLLYLHSLYIALFKFLLMIPFLTVVVLIWMLCTR